MALDNYPTDAFKSIYVVNKNLYTNGVQRQSDACWNQNEKKMSLKIILQL